MINKYDFYELVKLFVPMFSFQMNIFCTNIDLQCSPDSSWPPGSRVEIAGQRAVNELTRVSGNLHERAIVQIAS